MDDTTKEQPAGTGDEQLRENGTTPSLEDQLKAEQEKAEQYLRNWQLAAADLQNFRRRVEEERAEQSRFQKAALFINILPVFDDLSRAVEVLDTATASQGWPKGIVNIHSKFAALLDAMDVKRIESEGADFDPAWHEAISQQPGPEGKVIAVVEHGYLLGDRVLRAAKVVVGSGEPPPSSAGGR